MKKEKKGKTEKDQQKCEKCDEYLELAKRARADYENLKKDTEKWKADFVLYAHEAIVHELLPVLDNFNSAMAHIPADDQNKDWVVGIRFIKKQIEDVLKKEGLESFGKIGDTFDPTIHEAIQETEAKDAESGIIEKIVQHGYKINGKIVRAAKVVVVK